MLADAQKVREQIAEERAIFTRDEKLTHYIEEVQQIFLASSNRMPYRMRHIVANGIGFTYKSFSGMLPSEKSVDVVVSLGLPERTSHAHGEAWIRVEYYSTDHKVNDEPRIKKEFILTQGEVLSTIDDKGIQFAPLKTSSQHIDKELEYISDAIGFVFGHLQLDRNLNALK